MRLTGVVFDWAGTVVDHGSLAPAATLREIFRGAGVPVTIEEVRESMGLAKRLHIGAILALPRVAGAWKRVHGVPPAESDTERLYAQFVPKQLACLEEHSEVIAGVPRAVEALRTRGLRIGSTTGYTRPMLEFLLERAKGQGFAPDFAACPSDVPGGGRPAPWMCYLNAIHMKTAPMWSMVKVGDTPSDIADGINAGMWTIGISRTGNEVGWSAGEWESAPGQRKAEALARAEDRLRAAGAHYVAGSVGECLEAIAEIEARLAGERP